MEDKALALAGRATSEGTRRYRDRMVDKGVVASHFREAHGLMLSSVGLGTYLGKTDDTADQAYVDAVVEAVSSGCNVLDTAINYRHQRSERCLGVALEQLEQEGRAARDEIFVATKGGYIPLDTEVPDDSRAYFRDTFLVPGILKAEDVVAGMHCMSPTYLEHQIGKSLENLGLETVDLYYVHNPEGQIEAVGRPAFRLRVRQAFRALEAAVAAGRLTSYGTATWNGYRVEPDATEFLHLQEMVDLAKQAAEGSPALRFVQLPLNLAMTEALTLGNQPAGGDRKPSTLLAASDAGLAVMASASLLQGRLTSGLPPELGEALTGLESDAQRALQFVRSTPGITTALVGMSQVEHVQENMAVAKIPPASPEQLRRLFQRA
jgi:aryl-alcohol dehydrogenase-like predicted oxidoreductase